MTTLFGALYVIVGFVVLFWGVGLAMTFRRFTGIAVGIGTAVLGLFIIVHGFGILTSLNFLGLEGENYGGFWLLSAIERLTAIRNTAERAVATDGE